MERRCFCLQSLTLSEILTYHTVDSSWILTAYFVAGAVTTPIAGKLSDMYGRKKMIIIIMIVYIIGLVAGGFSTNYSFLLIARIIQGIGISMFPSLLESSEINFHEKNLQ